MYDVTEANAKLAAGWSDRLLRVCEDLLNLL